MNTKIIKSPSAPAAVGPYSQAVKACNLMFCSGQIPIVPATGKLVKGDITAQTTRVLENLKALLADQGLGLDRVVKNTVFLTDLANFAAMNSVYAQYFPLDPPARSTIQVAGLPLGALVEIEAIVSLA
jgi:2-iminobutanoate/2-iminopropanoate deaminase